MRIATVDIGTNTLLLLVVEVTGGRAPVPLVERATITRLGQGVDRTRALAPDAVSRTLACLEDYARVARELHVDRVAIVGTSAMRDAAGGESLRAAIRAMWGTEPRVVSGEEEARLAFTGSLSGLEVPAEEVGVFDVGGGSTEVVLGLAGSGIARIDYAESFDIGSVRLTERHVSHDPPAADERRAVTSAAQSAFARVPQLPGKHPPVGVAGTMTTLAAVSLELSEYDGARVHGHRMRREDLRRTLDRLASLDVAARRRLPGMEPNRADVIVAGGLIALALLDHWNAEVVQISDRGVRWGLALELALGH
jgi:exopolyphosphatase/guanosine-5'-triphosphate,3'-diphosphate pyrophosphatase